MLIKSPYLSFKTREIKMKKDASKKHTHKDSAPIKIAEPVTVDRRSRTDRKNEGKAIRLAVPLASHAQW